MKASKRTSRDSVESLVIPHDMFSNGIALVRHLISQSWSRPAKFLSVALLSARLAYAQSGDPQPPRHFPEQNPANVQHAPFLSSKTYLEHGHHFQARLRRRQEVHRRVHERWRDSRRLRPGRLTGYLFHQCSDRGDGHQGPACCRRTIRRRSASSTRRIDCG